ncbi:MAG: hypothetical protein JW963_17970 [Anaerolineales bacterium]|nr:hypothetical protein [Anaerolineales bacterium]
MGVVLEQEMKLKYKLPGYLATGLLTLATGLWTFWGIGEMYYEGWWGAWTNRLPYLAPMAACWTFALLSLTWPRLGGWIIFIVGGAFTAWRWILQARLGDLTLGWALGWIPISAIFILIGALFLLDRRFRCLHSAVGWRPYKQWWRRNLRYLVVFLPSLLTAIGVTILFAPLVSSRFDDGDRGARLIAGNGVALLWAPAGPGWSKGVGPSQEADRLIPGANLSWNDVAFYGIHPAGYGEKPNVQERNATEADMQITGLCRYLSEDGSKLMAEPQNIWRMPTTDEIVRSLVRGGDNAGCVWDGQSSSADCQAQPNKDTPLWNPDASPIYYYSGEDYDEGSAWCVPYTGGGLFGGVIGAQPKNGGNSRHGFRCVREP